MLIKSERHKPEDLELWQEYEKADLLVNIPPHLSADAIKEIHRFSREKNGAAYTSWGKDSVVMLHLLAISGEKIPVVYMRLKNRQGVICDNQDCEKVRDLFLEKFPLEYHERWFAPEDCRNNEHWQSLAKEFGQNRLTGVRGDESTNRRMSVYFHGLKHGNSWRPIGYWKMAHIFGWIAKYGLPLNPAYGCLGGGRWNRKYLRTHSIGGERGAERGRREWELEYYPEVMRRLGK